jgi:hypothetical protein
MMTKADCVTTIAPWLGREPGKYNQSAATICGRGAQSLPRTIPRCLYQKQDPVPTFAETGSKAFPQ